MTLNILVTDALSNPIVPDTLLINGVSSTGTETIADNSIVSISITANGYISYNNTFKVYDLDSTFTIILLQDPCKYRIDANPDPDIEEWQYFNECCHANFTIIENSCNNEKQIVKTSSSPLPLTLYDKDNKKVGRGDVITIPDYMICDEENRFLITSEEDEDCHCDGTEYPGCYEEIEVFIPKRDCACRGGFSFSNDFCYNVLYPFIDYETKTFFSRERWYLVQGVATTFLYNHNCIQTTLEVFDDATKSYVTIDFRRELTIRLAILQEGDVLIEDTFVLPDSFTDAELNTFLENLLLVYTFESKGYFLLQAEITNHCGTYRVEKEVFVTDEINLFVKENCRLYDIIICSNAYQVEVRKIGSTIPLATITVNGETITGNTEKIYVNEDFDLYLGLEDGVYEITITDGIATKRFVVVHFCFAKNCYLALSKKIYCEEEVVNEKYMYNVISFYMLYKLLLDYYYPAILHTDTTLSNSDYMRYVEIDKVLAKIKSICDACGSNLNITSENDCGCN